MPTQGHTWFGNGCPNCYTQPFWVSLTNTFCNSNCANQVQCYVQSEAHLAMGAINQVRSFLNPIIPYGVNKEPLEYFPAEVILS